MPGSKCKIKATSPITRQSPRRTKPYPRTPRAEVERPATAGLLAYGSNGPPSLPNRWSRSVALWASLAVYSCGGSRGFERTDVNTVRQAPRSLFTRARTREPSRTRRQTERRRSVNAGDAVIPAPRHIGHGRRATSPAISRRRRRCPSAVLRHSPARRGRRHRRGSTAVARPQRFRRACRPAHR